MVDKRRKEKRKKGRCWHVGYTTCTPDDVPCDYWSACSDTSIKGSRQLGFFSQLAITPRQDDRSKTRRIVILVDSGWNSLSFRIERFLFWIFRQFVVRLIFPSLSIPFDKFGIKRVLFIIIVVKFHWRWKDEIFFNRKSLPRPNLSILQMILVLSSFHFSTISSPPRLKWILYEDRAIPSRSIPKLIGRQSDSLRTFQQIYPSMYFRRFILFSSRA